MGFISWDICISDENAPGLDADFENTVRINDPAHPHPTVLYGPLLWPHLAWPARHLALLATLLASLKSHLRSARHRDTHNPGYECHNLGLSGVIPKPPDNRGRNLGVK